MTGITHKQAGRYMRKALDGLLTADQRRDLQTHLDECAACRLESETLSLLTARLKTDFHARWDTQHGPSKNVMANVQSQTRRIIMKKRIDFAFNILGGAAALLVLFFVVTSVISQFQKKSTAADTTQATNGTAPVSEQSSSIATNKFNGEWIAFITAVDQSLTSENFETDVFMIRPDGSGLVNLTNSPAEYYHLQWSPNGNKLVVLQENNDTINIIRMNQTGGSEVIAGPITDRDHHGYSWSPNSEKIIFADSSNGNYDIYTMYADGRNDPQLTQLTNDPGQDVGFVWSPDGNQIAFERLDGEKLSVYIMNEDGSNQREVAHGSGKVKLRWLLDGKSIYASSTENNWLECEVCIAKPAVYQIDLVGQSVRQIYAEQDASKVLAWYLYDTPQNTLYFMRIDPPAFVEFWGTWMQADGSSVHEIGSMDPQQTCKTATGNSLNEHISPNERFSVISNYCAGGFDLYLADRETLDPEKKFVHLLKLPADTFGQGGNTNTLPITWSPDGRWLIYDNGQATEYLLNVERAMQDPTTEPSLLFRSVISSVFEIAWQPALANNVTDQNPTPEPAQTSNELVAFMAETNLATNNNTDIYTMRMDGSSVTNLTHDPAKDFNANDYNPAWSPDKKKIAFISDRGGNSTGNTDIYVMNPDGSDQTRLTNNPGFDDFLAWSPDGKHIAYYSSPVDEFYATGKIIIMNSDGSNKTVITQEPGYYYFQGWSPDGQKIVYGKPRLVGESFKDIGIYIVDIDGKNQHEWFVGNFDQLHWEDSEHFLGVVQTGTETQPQWTLYSFSTDGSQREIATHSAPIAAFFENTYVIDGQDGPTWFTHAGNPIPAIPWDPAEECQATGDSFISTSHVIAPDKKQAFVMINCEKSNLFYLENEDGSKIEPLNGSIDASLGLFPQWSSDGKYVSINTFNTKDPFAETVVYLFDIEKMLKDPSTQPIQTTLNMTVSGQLVFGFPPGDNDKLQEPTPKPLTFSLTAQQAKLLANFTVLEPSYLPAGYILEGMDYDPYTHKIAMKYISQQSEGALFVYQRRGDFVHDPAVQAYVTPVSIGDMEAEYVQGAWIYDTPETTTPRWDPSATFYSLTWQKGEIVFSIDFLGGETITPLSLADFVAIAEGLK